jgi:multicomponent Na+:H+ antiporter subunit C
MSPALVYMLSSAAVVGVCLYALILRVHLFRKVVAVNIMGSGVFLLLTGLARRGPEADAVPHAMVLTGIVVAVSATAFALALLRRLQEVSGESCLPEDSEEVVPREEPGGRVP